MKGCYNYNPSRPRYSITWDINIVLNFMSSSGDNATLDFRMLSKKLVTLLAVSTWMRSSELAVIDRHSILITEEGVSFSLLAPRKSQKKGPMRSFFLKRFENTKTCPVECLSVYLIYTFDNFSVTHERLLLSFVAPNNPVAGNTVGRWIKSYLNLAGIDTTIFSAHSTRSAAASNAARLGMPIDAILKSGDWKHESTFARFYYRKV